MITIAAERVLDPNGVVARLYVPERQETSGDWTCKITLDDSSFETLGVDAFQALLLALVALESQYVAGIQRRPTVRSL